MAKQAKEKIEIPQNQSELDPTENVEDEKKKGVVYLQRKHLPQSNGGSYFPCRDKTAENQICGFGFGGNFCAEQHLYQRKQCAVPDGFGAGLF